MLVCKAIKCNEFIIIEAQTIYVDSYKPFSYFPTYEHSWVIVLINHELSLLFLIYLTNTVVIQFRK